MESKFKFINFPVTTNIQEVSFDLLNPLVKFLSPFSDLYKEYSKKEYDKIMWALTLLNYPDERKNILYRENIKERIKIVKREFDIDLEQPLVKKANSLYPIKCLTAVQKALKEEIDTLVNRAEYINSFDYKEATLKEIKDFEYLRSQTGKIYDRYEQLQEKLLKEDATEGEVYGGRQETLSEQRVI